MSQENRTDEEGARQLSIVYKELEQDAKMLVEDLSEGVIMWRAAAYLMAIVSVLGFFLLWITIDPAAIALAIRPVEYATSTFMGASALVGALVCARKFVRLRSKYEKLFEAAKRLS